MGIIRLIGIGLSLSADAFAAVVASLSVEKESRKKKAVIFSLSFAFFQFFMPIAGYYLSESFCGKIKKLGAPIAFVIFFTVGLNMLLDYIYKEKEESVKSVSFLKLLSLSFATSIDALAVGTSFYFLNTDIFLPSVIIGAVTFCVCMTGAYFSGKIKNERLFGIISGLILILLSLKTLVEYLI